MAGVMMDNGSKEVLTEDKAAWNTTALKVHLFVNNITPAVGDVLGSYTEASFTGYAAQSLVTWGTITVGSHIATMTAAANTFTRTATGTVQTVYGYYVTDNTNTVLLWAERDVNAPINIINNGDSYTVTATMTAKDQSL